MRAQTQAARRTTATCVWRRGRAGPAEKAAAEATRAAKAAVRISRLSIGGTHWPKRVIIGFVARFSFLKIKIPEKSGA